MDKITGGKKLKELFRGDTVLHDNFLFKLHHQANFFVVLFGVAFIFGMNYSTVMPLNAKVAGVSRNNIAGYMALQISTHHSIRQS